MFSVIMSKFNPQICTIYDSLKNVPLQHSCYLTAGVNYRRYFYQTDDQYRQRHCQTVLTIKDMIITRQHVFHLNTTQTRSTTGEVSQSMSYKHLAIFCFQTCKEQGNHFSDIVWYADRTAWCV